MKCKISFCETESAGSSAGATQSTPSRSDVDQTTRQQSEGRITRTSSKETADTPVQACLDPSMDVNVSDSSMF